MTLELAFLGGFEARTEAGELVALPAGKVGGLLAYLAMSAGHSRPRESLAALFWEGSSEAQARNSLRQALAVLRRALARAGGGILRADKERAWLVADGLRIDASQFERLIRAGTPPSLEQAATLYRGEFLQGFSVASDAFEEWARAERTRFRELIEGALCRLFDHYERDGEPDRAIQAAIRLLALDPLREDVHRALIRLYLRQSRRAQALWQYEHCRNLLWRELKAAPEIETRRLIEPLRRPVAGVRVAELHPETDRFAEDPDGRAGIASGLRLVCSADIPSIAVRPFYLLRQTEQTRMAAIVLREGIECSLSRFRELRVIVHSGMRQGDGAAIGSPPSSPLAGADFVLEGTLDDRDESLQISIRLFAASSRTCLWADQFAVRGLDYLERAEGLVRQIVAAICPALERRQLDQIRATPLNSLNSYPLALFARAQVNRLTPSSVERAVRLARRAIRLDPNNGLAFSTLALARVFQIRMGWATSHSECLSEAVDAAEEALILDCSDAAAHGVRGLVHLWSGAHDLALRSTRRGLNLNPNRTDLLHWHGLVHDFAGQSEQAIRYHQAAVSLAPHHITAFAAANGMAGAYYEIGAFPEAAHWARESISMYPRYRRSHAVLAASLARLGDPDGAGSALAKARALDPALSLKTQLSGYAYKDSGTVASWERGYRTAGLS